MVGSDGVNNTVSLQTAPWVALPAWQTWIIVQHPYKNAVIAANDKFAIYPAVVI